MSIGRQKAQLMDIDGFVGSLNDNKEGVNRDTRSFQNEGISLQISHSYVWHHFEAEISKKIFNRLYNNILLLLYIFFFWF